MLIKKKSSFKKVIKNSLILIEQQNNENDSKNRTATGRKVKTPGSSKKHGVTVEKTEHEEKSARDLSKPSENEEIIEDQSTILLKSKKDRRVPDDKVQPFGTKLTQ